MSHRTFQVLSLISVVAAFAACGGGSSGGAPGTAGASGVGGAGAAGGADGGSAGAGGGGGSSAGIGGSLGTAGVSGAGGSLGTSGASGGGGSLGTAGSTGMGGAGGTGVAAVKCGVGPFVRLSGGVADPLEKLQVFDVMVTSSLCPSMPVMVGQQLKGGFAMDITQGAPFTLRLQKTGYITTLMGELVLTADKSGVDLSLFSMATATKYVPAWTPGTAAIVVGVEQSGTAGCTTKEAITFAVVGHPTAKIVYNGNPALTATDAKGLVWVHDLPAGTAQLTATKPGCTVLVGNYAGTANTPLVADVITQMVALIK